MPYRVTLLGRRCRPRVQRKGGSQEAWWGNIRAWHKGQGSQEGCTRGGLGVPQVHPEVMLTRLVKDTWGTWGRAASLPSYRRRPR